MTQVAAVRSKRKPWLERIGPLRKVTRAERDAFERDGVTHLRAILPPDWVAELAGTLDDCFSEERPVVTGADLDYSQFAALAAHLGGTTLNDNPDQQSHGRALIKTDVHHVHAGFYFFAHYSPFAQVVADLADSREVRLYEDQIFLKESGSGIRTAFHQDASYFHVGGETCCVCWASPDVVTRENGAMGYVLGSHKWGKIFQANLFASQTVMPGSIGDTLPDIEGNEADYDIRYIDSAPGDMIIHDYRTVHGAIGNTSATMGRRAASIRYTTDNAHFLFRQSAPAAANALRDYSQFSDGDAFSGEDFPLAWPR
ncbi:MAG: phytanoyl-CoA dioxygenase family protein [Sphingomonadaceae bacterium]|nr:phytanoyl-CoA dioxygenase family protein [Sphingomonadaceae bacterium]